jgi:hypothetical protein
LLLAAVFVLVNQLDGFTNIGIGSIVAAILSLAVIVECISHLRFAPLPIPLAILYIIFRTPLGLPDIKTWPLILASVLASLGLAVLIPRRSKRVYHEFKCGGKPKNNTRPESGGNDNNPYIGVNFGSISRSLRANNLETVRLDCNFGSLQVYFDQVELSPNGCQAILNCSFGAIELFIPKHWRIVDKMNCTLGGIDISKRFASAAQEGAPTLTLTGSVSLGGVEARHL